MNLIRKYLSERCEIEDTDQYIDLLENLLAMVATNLADELFDNPDDIEEKIIEVLDSNMDVLSDLYLHKMSLLVSDSNLSNIECDGHA